MTAHRIALLAPAKVNLFLAVGELRSDGYHDVVTILQALDESVADVVELTAADSLSVTCAPDIGVAAEENLVHRALVRLGEIAGRAPEFSVLVHKRVPAAGGLGGASSDAAAALTGACRLWGLDESSAEVIDVAKSLGADVPFFLGGGTALYDGRGDSFVRRMQTPDLALVVINPGVSVPTPAAYAAFDQQLRNGTPDASAMIDAIDSGNPVDISAALFNNLTEAAIGLAPEVLEALQFLSQSDGILGSLVSGSGSSVFGICENTESAQRVARLAAVRDGWWASATSASAGGITEVEPG